MTPGGGDSLFRGWESEIQQQLVLSDLIVKFVELTAQPCSFLLVTIKSLMNIRFIVYSIQCVLFKKNLEFFTKVFEY